MSKLSKKKQTIPAPQPNVLETRPVQQQGRLVHHRQTVQTVKTIFDPDVLEQYSRLVPDAPERVLRQFELNSEAERAMLTGSLEAQRADNRRRDWMAFVIVVGGLLLAALTGWLGIPWLSGVTLAAIVSYAILGYLSKPKTPKPPPDQQS